MSDRRLTFAEADILRHIGTLREELGKDTVPATLTQFVAEHVAGNTRVVRALKKDGLLEFNETFGGYQVTSRAKAALSRGHYIGQPREHLPDNAMTNLANWQQRCPNQARSPRWQFMDRPPTDKEVEKDREMGKGVRGVVSTAPGSSSSKRARRSGSRAEAGTSPGLARKARRAGRQQRYKGLSEVALKNEIEQAPRALRAEIEEDVNAELARRQKEQKAKAAASATKVKKSGKKLVKSAKEKAPNKKHSKVNSTGTPKKVRHPWDGAVDVTRERLRQDFALVFTILEERKLEGGVWPSLMRALASRYLPPTGDPSLQRKKAGFLASYLVRIGCLTPEKPKSKYGRWLEGERLKKSLPTFRHYTTTDAQFAVQSLKRAEAEALVDTCLDGRLERSGGKVANAPVTGGANESTPAPSTVPTPVVAVRTEAGLDDLIKALKALKRHGRVTLVLAEQTEEAPHDAEANVSA